MSDVDVNEGVVREIFRRFALAGDGHERVTAPTLPSRSQAQMDAFADAMRDAVNGAAVRDSVGFGKHCARPNRDARRSRTSPSVCG